MVRAAEILRSGFTFFTKGELGWMRGGHSFCGIDVLLWETNCIQIITLRCNKSSGGI